MTSLHYDDEWLVKARNFAQLGMVSKEKLTRKRNLTKTGNLFYIAFSNFTKRISKIKGLIAQIIGAANNLQF